MPQIALPKPSRPNKLVKYPSEQLPQNNLLVIYNRNSSRTKKHVNVTVTKPNSGQSQFKNQNY